VNSRPARPDPLFSLLVAANRAGCFEQGELEDVMKISEKEFMAMVIKRAKLGRWFVYHTHDSRRSVAGFPDLVLLRPPQIVVAELKVGKNRVTPEQNLWLNLFEEAGVPAYVWRETDWNEIDEVLA
jgi:hypothetical protein